MAKFVVVKGSLEPGLIAYEMASDAINDLIDEMLVKGKVPDKFKQAHKAAGEARDKLDTAWSLYTEAQR